MKIVFKHMRPYLKEVIAVSILVVLTAMSALLLPDFMSRLIGEGIWAEYYIDGVLVPDGGTCDLVNTAGCTLVQVSDFGIISKYSLIMLGVTLASSLAAIGLMFFSSRLGSYVSRDLRSDLYKKVNSLSILETSKFGTSTLITRATNDVTQVQNFIMMGSRMILRIPVLFIGSMIFALSKSAHLTGVIGYAVPILIALIALVFIFVMPLFKKQQKKIDKLTMVTRESINGVRVIRAFGQGEKEVSRFHEANEDLTNLQYKIGKFMSVLNPSINLVFNLAMVGILFMGYSMLTGGIITNYQGIANVTAVFQYAMQIMFSILMLTMTFIMYPRAQVSANRIKEILETDTTIVDEGLDEYDEYNFKGNIKFEDVCFKFPEADSNILENINFEAKPGETVAIIGSTGSGKSTIVNLIPRLMDITCGNLTIDGVPIRDIKLPKLREQIGYITQKAQLFSGTIKENIAFGKENATQEEIEEAAKIAQAEDFIEALDEKYDTYVEQGGVNFSGGQKQRLSIARSLVRKPKIYIFDDSFSALDFKTDANLRMAMREQVKNSTVLIVAQRIGTIMDADKIIVLQEGRMVGYGKHKDLLKDCKVYREIALSQMEEEELQ
ncbi:ABC transporter ATP-binding protein [Candidatus Izemoplasma sp. B36]|uniref:ABC transporter ATP-binding protein n=1 Tax=Candidatus Izemoplasma sp. B36 TaxID=3242468 RepID=UPI003558C3E7